MTHINKMIDKKLKEFKVSFRRYLKLNGVDKQDHISDPSGGTTVDTEARAAIDEILVALEKNGITKNS